MEAAKWKFIDSAGRPVLHIVYRYQDNFNNMCVDHLARRWVLKDKLDILPNKFRVLREYKEWAYVEESATFLEITWLNIHDAIAMLHRREYETRRKQEDRREEKEEQQ